MNAFRQDTYSDVSADRAPQTARSLSPALRQWALARFAPAFRIWVLVVVGVANMLGGVVFLAMYFLWNHDVQPRAQGQSLVQIEQARHALIDILVRPGLAPDARKKITAALVELNPGRKPEDIEAAPEWLLWGGIGWIAFDLAIVGGIVILTKARGAWKGRQLLALLERGQVGQAQVIANRVDYSIKVNGAPRRVVTLSVEGRPMEIRTFDNNFANLFAEGDAIEVLYDERIPKMVFPTSQIPAL